MGPKDRFVSYYSHLLSTIILDNEWAFRSTENYEKSQARIMSLIRLIDVRNYVL